ncbi:MAG: CBS domain-containing protein [Candidatus Binatia bacterium]
MVKVRDCFCSVSAGVDLVSPEATVEEVIARVTRDPASRAVFVVDESQRLLGIIGVREILSVLGGKYSSERPFAQTRELLATNAGDLMGAPFWVSPDDDLEEGLRIAVQQDLQDIPVVENGRVIGNLDCLEIIVNYRAARQHQDEGE